MSVPKGGTSDIVFKLTISALRLGRQPGRKRWKTGEGWNEYADMLADVLLENTDLAYPTIEDRLNRAMTAWNEMTVKVSYPFWPRVVNVVNTAVDVDGAVGCAAFGNDAGVIVTVMTQGAVGDRLAGQWLPGVFIHWAHPGERFSQGGQDRIDVRVDMDLPALPGWVRTEGHHGYWRKRGG